MNFVIPESFIHFLAAMAPLQLQGLVERREVSTARGSELYYRATYLTLTPIKVDTNFVTRI